VLQIKADGKLHAITFGHPEQLHVGDVVLAIGNPFGVGQTVTMGIVSASGAPTWASIPSRTSSRPTPRSIPAIPEVPWSMLPEI
jgi:S1-C subfamily serine protease